MVNVEVKCKSEDCKRFEVKHANTCKAQIFVKNESGRSRKTIESQTATQKGELTLKDKLSLLKTQVLRKQLAFVSARLQIKIDECVARDEFVTSKDLADTQLDLGFAAYQEFTPDEWMY